MGKNTTNTGTQTKPTRMTIDEVDAKILKILQADGRTALSEIARRLDMGSATIHERVNTLEEEGYIQDYRAVLDAELLGLDDVAFIRVETEAGRFSEVAERLAEEGAIQEIHEITGETDLLLKVRVGDREDLTDFLSRIGKYEGVVSTKTDVALRSVKEENRLNIPEE